MRLPASPSLKLYFYIKAHITGAAPNIVGQAFFALLRRYRGMAVEGFRRREGFACAPGLAIFVLRDRPRRTAFPVTVDLKILRHAVPLRIGKPLMAEMGGGLIRPYRRPQNAVCAGVC